MELDPKFSVDYYKQSGVALIGKIRKFKFHQVLKGPAPEVLEKVSHAYPEILDYRMPAQGGDAEVSSLLKQMAKRISAKRSLTSEEVEEIVDEIVPLYPCTCVPLVVRTMLERPDSLSRVVIEKLTDGHSINTKASPGYPFSIIGSTKKEVLERVFGDVVDSVVDRLWRLAAIEPDELRKLSPSQLVEGGYVDVVSLFVKGEPHTIKKCDEGAWRLISNVSFTDEVVCRLLCQLQNQTEIRNWTVIPSQPGIGFNDEMLQIICDWIATPLGPGLKFLGQDCSAWDINVKEDMYYADSLRRVKLARGSDAELSLFSRMIFNMNICLSKSVFLTSTGLLFEQCFVGMVKSGSYNTSSSNSFMRVYRARCVGATIVVEAKTPSGWMRVCVTKTMGDDCIECHKSDMTGEELVRRYAEFGTKIKEESIEIGAENGLEFCSHKFFPTGKVERLNVAKTVFTLLRGPRDDVKLENCLTQDIRFAPDLPRIVQALRDSGRYPGFDFDVVCQGGWVLANDNQG